MNMNMKLNERGAAYILAITVMLLVFSLGLSILYIADTEILAAKNYSGNLGCYEAAVSGAVSAVYKINSLLAENIGGAINENITDEAECLTVSFTLSCENAAYSVTASVSAGFDADLIIKSTALNNNTGARENVTAVASYMFRDGEDIPFMTEMRKIKKSA